MVRTHAKLSEIEAGTWTKAESLVQTNADIFHEIIRIHHELLLKALDRPRHPRKYKFERALALLAAKNTHMLRGAWISAMSGYPGATQPLVRAIYETSLTMFYLRAFPSEFGIWKKDKKSDAEAKKFWPSAMMGRLKSSEEERKVLSILAQQAHPTLDSVGMVGAYDPSDDDLEISIGTLLDRDMLVRITSLLCLYGVISAYAIARSVNHALVEGLPDKDQETDFMGRMQGLLNKREKVEMIGGTHISDVLKGRKQA